MDILTGLTPLQEFARAEVVQKAIVLCKVIHALTGPGARCHPSVLNIIADHVWRRQDEVISLANLLIRDNT